MSNPYYQDEQVTLHLGDALNVVSTLPPDSVDCVVTSPPYFGLRDYGVPGQYGAEGNPADFATTLVRLFSEIRRVLADDGTVWLNLGDSYVSKPAGVKGVSGKSGLNGANSARYRATLEAGHGTKRDTTGMGVPEKNLFGIPWRVALALQDDGWTLRNDIIWSKPNAMPESIRDRLSNTHEHLFLLTKSRRYHFDLDAIKVDKVGGTGRKNPGDVWAINTKPFRDAHFATFPPEIPRRAITAGCKPGGVVLDPFSGSATTGMAALELGRKYVGIDIKSAYHDLALDTRLRRGTLDLGAIA